MSLLAVVVCGLVLFLALLFMFAKVCCQVSVVCVFSCIYFFSTPFSVLSFLHTISLCVIVFLLSDVHISLLLFVFSCFLYFYYNF